MNLTTPLRILSKTVLWALGVVAVFVLAIVAINAFDEDLSPQTAALSKARDNPYAPEENLYIALVGFDAPEGQSVVTVGQERVAENDIAAAKFLNDPRTLTESLERSKDRKKTEFKGKPDFCRPITGSCWTGVESHQPEINGLLGDNQELYRRYLALPALRGYFETANPSYLMIFTNVPGGVRALFLTNTALRIRTGTTVRTKNAALVDLRNDVSTWRRMLVGNGGLISKMLAIASLHGDYVLLGDMIADPNIDLAPLSAEIEGTLLQVGMDDWKLRNVFANEFRISVSMYEQLKSARTSAFRPGSTPEGEDPGWWEMPWARVQDYLLKVHATENISALAMIELQKAAEAEPRELLAAQETFHRWSDRNLRFWPSLLYNPLGKTLVSVGVSAYDAYPLRAYDVAAYARGVHLAYEIRKQRVPASDIPAFSRRHPEWATHPVNGEPFAWDPEARELRIRTMGKSYADRRFSIPVWIAPAT